MSSPKRLNIERRPHSRGEGKPKTKIALGVLSDSDPTKVGNFIFTKDTTPHRGPNGKYSVTFNDGTQTITLEDSIHVGTMGQVNEHTFSDVDGADVTIKSTTQHDAIHVAVITRPHEPASEERKQDQSSEPPKELTSEYVGELLDACSSASATSAVIDRESETPIRSGLYVTPTAPLSGVFNVNAAGKTGDSRTIASLEPTEDSPAALRFDVKKRSYVLILTKQGDNVDAYLVLETRPPRAINLLEGSHLEKARRNFEGVTPELVGSSTGVVQILSALPGNNVSASWSYNEHTLVVKLQLSAGMHIYNLKVLEFTPTEFSKETEIDHDGHTYRVAVVNLPEHSDDGAIAVLAEDLGLQGVEITGVTQSLFGTEIGHGITATTTSAPDTHRLYLSVSDETGFSFSPTFSNNDVKPGDEGELVFTKGGHQYTARFSVSEDGDTVTVALLESVNGRPVRVDVTNPTPEILFNSDYINELIDRFEYSGTERTPVLGTGQTNLFGNFTLSAQSDGTFLLLQDGKRVKDAVFTSRTVNQALRLNTSVGDQYAIVMQADSEGRRFVRVIDEQTWTPVELKATEPPRDSEPKQGFSKVIDHSDGVGTQIPELDITVTTRYGSGQPFFVVTDPNDGSFLGRFDLDRDSDLTLRGPTGDTRTFTFVGLTDGSIELQAQESELESAPTTPMPSRERREADDTPDEWTEAHEKAPTNVYMPPEREEPVEDEPTIPRAPGPSTPTEQSPPHELSAEDLAQSGVAGDGVYRTAEVPAVVNPFKLMPKAVVIPLDTTRFDHFRVGRFCSATFEYRGNDSGQIVATLDISRDLKCDGVRPVTNDEVDIINGSRAPGEELIQGQMIGNDGNVIGPAKLEITRSMLSTTEYPRAKMRLSASQEPFEAMVIWDNQGKNFRLLVQGLPEGVLSEDNASTEAMSKANPTTPALLIPSKGVVPIGPTDPLTGKPIFGLGNPTIDGTGRLGCEVFVKGAVWGWNPYKPGGKPVRIQVEESSSRSTKQLWLRHRGVNFEFDTAVSIARQGGNNKDQEVFAYVDTDPDSVKKVDAAQGGKRVVGKAAVIVLGAVAVLGTVGVMGLSLIDSSRTRPTPTNPPVALNQPPEEDGEATKVLLPPPEETVPVQAEPDASDEAAEWEPVYEGDGDQVPDRAVEPVDSGPAAEPVPEPEELQPPEPGQVEQPEEVPEPEHEQEELPGAREVRTEPIRTKRRTVERPAPPAPAETVRAFSSYPDYSSSVRAAYANNPSFRSALENAAFNIAGDRDVTSIRLNLLIDTSGNVYLYSSRRGRGRRLGTISPPAQGESRASIVVQL